MIHKKTWSEFSDKWCQDLLLWAIPVPVQFKDILKINAFNLATVDSEPLEGSHLSVVLSIIFQSCFGKSQVWYAAACIVDCMGLKWDWEYSLSRVRPELPFLGFEYRLHPKKFRMTCRDFRHGIQTPRYDNTFWVWNVNCHKITILQKGQSKMTCHIMVFHNENCISGYQLRSSRPSPSRTSTIQYYYTMQY